MRYAGPVPFVGALKSATCRVYCVAVPSDYERSQFFDAILRHVGAPERPLLRLSGEGVDLSLVYNHLEAQSLFGGEPVLVLDEVEKASKGAVADLQKLCTRSFGYLILGSRAKSPLIEAAAKEGAVLDLLGEKPWERDKRIREHLVALVQSAGKTISSDALALLLERCDAELGLLEREIEKAVCYIGDQPHIATSDIAAVSSSNKPFAIWQTAEQMVWEGTGTPRAEFFHPLIPALRSQLQLGLKIASLIAADATPAAWSEALPKIFPKTIDKRSAGAQRLGARYFARGLELLFDIELRSRSGSPHYGVLLDFFRCQLRALCR